MLADEAGSDERGRLRIDQLLVEQLKATVLGLRVSDFDRYSLTLAGWLINLTVVSMTTMIAAHAQSER